MTAQMVARAAQRQSGWVAVGLGVLLFLIGSWQIEGFASARSMKAILVLASLVALAAIGQTLVVIAGGIDLSAPFLIGVGNVLAAEAFASWLPQPLVFVAVVVLTGLFGVANGAISFQFGVHPLIVTLGLGTFAQAAALFWTDGFPSGAAPGWITRFVSIGSSTGPIPVPPIVLLVGGMVALTVFVERSTAFGRRLFGLGSNRAAAELALTRSRAVWITAFAVSGALSGLTGLFLLGFTGTASGTVGQPYLFQIFAAVVIGGTALTGGSGSVARTMVGAIVLLELTSILVGVGVSSSLVEAALGALIIVLVALYGRESHLRDRV